MKPKYPHIVANFIFPSLTCLLLFSLQTTCIVYERTLYAQRLSIFKLYRKSYTYIWLWLFMLQLIQLGKLIDNYLPKWQGSSVMAQQFKPIFVKPLMMPIGECVMVNCNDYTYGPDSCQYTLDDINRRPKPLSPYLPRRRPG